MSGKAIVLTDAKISKLKFNPKGPNLQRHWDAVQSGLMVTVYPVPHKRHQTGRKTFSVRYDLPDGRQRIKKIGNFPEMDLAKARETAAMVRGRQTIPLTFEEAYRKIEDNLDRVPMGKNSERTLEVFRSVIRTHWMPILRKCTLEDLDAKIILARIDELVEQGKFGAAEAARYGISNFYRNLHALGSYYRDVDNPLVGKHVFIPKFKPKRKVFTEDELRAIWDGGSPILRFLMLTGQRVHQVFDLKWEEVTEDTIRWDNMKRKNTVHVLPLTDSLREIISDQPRESKFVFQCHTKYTDSLVQQLFKHCQVKGTPHMFRHTFATLGLDAGLSYEGIARVLHHTLPGMTSRYSRDAQAIEIKLSTLKKWSAHITELVHPV